MRLTKYLDVQSKAKVLQELSAKMEVCRKEYLQHSKDIQTLERRIKEAETVCGQMTQQHLEIGRAIELKRKCIAEDKAQLLDKQSF